MKVKKKKTKAGGMQRICSAAKGIYCKSRGGVNSKRQLRFLPQNADALELGSLLGQPPTSIL